MSQPPAWLESLVDLVAASMEPHAEMGPLEFRYLEEERLWDITVYPSPIQLVGDPADGVIVSPGFSLDLEQLRSGFERIEAIHWHALPFGPYDRDGVCIFVEGRYQDRDILLRVLAEAPDDEEPALQVDVSGLPPNENTKVH